MRGAVVLLRQLFLPPCYFAGQTNDHVVFIGLTKPTIHQARDRAGVVSGATRPEWVTSAGSLERLLTGARKRARDDGERRWNIMSNWTFVEADITRLMPGTKICSGNV